MHVGIDIWLFGSISTGTRNLHDAHLFKQCYHEKFPWCPLGHAARAHFTKFLQITLDIVHNNLNQIIISPQNVTHAPTALLLVHVQHFVVIVWDIYRKFSSSLGSVKMTACETVPRPPLQVTEVMAAWRLWILSWHCLIRSMLAAYDRPGKSLCQYHHFRLLFLPLKLLLLWSCIILNESYTVPFHRV